MTPSPAEVIDAYSQRLRHGPIWGYWLARNLARAGAVETERRRAEALVDATWPGDETAQRCFSAGWLAGRSLVLA
jgi:hypothetical protein